LNIYHQTGWYLEWEGMDIASVGKMKTGMNCYRVNVQEWEGIGMGGVGTLKVIPTHLTLVGLQYLLSD